MLDQVSARPPPTPARPSALLKPFSRSRKLSFIRKSATMVSESPPPSPDSVEMYSNVSLVTSYIGVAVRPQRTSPQCLLARYSWDQRTFSGPNPGTSGLLLSL